MYESNNIDDRDTCIGDYFEYAGIRTLDDDSRNMFDIFPYIKEYADAVKIMKINKSPGCDGRPIEFYKFFGMISNTIIIIRLFHRLPLDRRPFHPGISKSCKASGKPRV